MHARRPHSCLGPTLMPIVVDSIERQAHISEVASAIIEKEGLQGLTIRAIAREAGCSTSFITDFFSDKRAILLRVLQDAAHRATIRIDQALSRDPLDLLGCVEAYLPLTDDVRRDWCVYFAFWNIAAHDELFAREQRRSQDFARSHFAKLLVRLGTPQDQAFNPASRLLSFVIGLSTQAVFDRANCSPELQRQLAREAVTLLLDAHDHSKMALSD